MIGSQFGPESQLTRSSGSPGAVVTVTTTVMVSQLSPHHTIESSPYVMTTGLFSVGESVGLAVGLGVAVGESVGLAVGLGVAVGESVGLAVGLGVAVGESVGLAVASAKAADVTSTSKTRALMVATATRRGERRLRDRDMNPSPSLRISWTQPYPCKGRSKRRTGAGRERQHLGQMLDAG
jgi:hypothetical protein